MSDGENGREVLSYRIQTLYRKRQRLRTERRKSCRGGFFRRSEHRITDRERRDILFYVESGNRREIFRRGIYDVDADEEQGETLYGDMHIQVSGLRFSTSTITLSSNPKFSPGFDISWNPNLDGFASLHQATSIAVGAAPFSGTGLTPGTGA